MAWNPQQLHKSRRDVWLSGVCGGLGESTPLPSWLWRALFVATCLGTGIGLVVYLALWMFMPRVSPAPPPAPGGGGNGA